jgi:hypothetical protein
MKSSWAFSRVKWLSGEKTNVSKTISVLFLRVLAWSFIWLTSWAEEKIRSFNHWHLTFGCRHSPLPWNIFYCPVYVSKEMKVKPMLAGQIAEKREWYWYSLPRVSCLMYEHICYALVFIVSSGTNRLLSFRASFYSDGNRENKRVSLNFSVWKFSVIRRCIQKFLDWVNNEIYAYNNKHSLRSNTKAYGGKTH